MTALSKRSRWTRCPTGKPVILSARDLEIFKLLNRYRYLRSSTLVAFFAKKDKTYLARRLADLYHEQPYLGRYNTRKRLPNADHQDDVYELTNLSRQVLTHNGIHPKPADYQAGSLGEFRHFQHALMICDILSSIELGCIATNNRFITWGEILNRSRKQEYKIKVPLDGREQTLTPDGLFGIEYPDQSRRFFALEADRGTEPLTRKTLHGSSYQKKLLLYRAILHEHQGGRIHQTWWGIPNLFVLNVTTSEERMENIKRVLLDITNGRGNTVILFKTHKGTPFTAPPADGHVLLEPWNRAGYPLLRIDVAEERKVSFEP